MTEHFDDRNDPDKSVLIKDRVVVRDDSKLSGVTMLAALVAIVIAGGALVYALTGSHDTTTTAIAPSTEQSDGTVGQAPRAPAPNAQ
jgi:hypothetical protein